MADQKLIRVRAVAAGDENGHWGVFGSADMTDAESEAMVLEFDIGESWRVTIIEVDIPLPPEVETVEGEIAEDQGDES